VKKLNFFSSKLKFAANPFAVIAAKACKKKAWVNEIISVVHEVWSNFLFKSDVLKTNKRHILSSILDKGNHQSFHICQKKKQ